VPFSPEARQQLTRWRQKPAVPEVYHRGCGNTDATGSEAKTFALAGNAPMLWSNTWQ